MAFRLLSRERQRELEAKGRLCLAEAAEYLEMASKTLYNRISRARTHPGYAPHGDKRIDGDWEFLIPDLKAWKLRARHS